MGVRINWRDAAGLQGQVELGFTEIFIGRAVECAIRTDDPLVSRRHARIFYQNGSYVIEDLGSANGIFLGEQRVPQHMFQNGDSVRAGNLWMTLQDDGPGAFGQSPQAMGGPQMSSGGGTQILQINEAFIPGRASEAAAVGPAPGGLPPNPFGSPMGGLGGPPPMGGGGMGGMGGMGSTSLPGGPGGSGPPMGATSMGGMGGFGAPPPPAMGGGATSMGGMGGFGAPPPAMPMPMGGGPPPAMPMGGGPPPPAMGGGATSIGGALGGGPPPPAPGPAGRSSGGGGPPGVMDAAEIQRMQRRLDQLSSELRMQRGGGDKALKFEELEDKISRLEKENIALEQRYRELEKMAQAAGSDYSISSSVVSLSRAEEVVVGLNDVLSELRINLLATEGELEQYANSLPQASYRMIRDSITASRAAMESARDYMRMLRDVR